MLGFKPLATNTVEAVDTQVRVLNTDLREHAIPTSLFILSPCHKFDQNHN